MFRFLLALLLVAPSVFAQSQSTAYEALRVVGTQVSRAFISRVISVTGTNGDPQPVTWIVTVSDKTAVGGVREIEVANGQVVAQRTPTDAVSVAKRSPINTRRLNLDSNGAFSVVNYTADTSHVTFASVSYRLRNDDRGYPVWLVTLVDDAGRPVGTIQIGANKGNVTRVEGMFRGNNELQPQPPAPGPQIPNRTRPPERMADTGRYDSEPDYTADSDDDDGDVNPVKKRIKQSFRRARDHATRMFSHVRRSFDDYFYRR